MVCNNLNSFVIKTVQVDDASKSCMFLKFQDVAKW